MISVLYLLSAFVTQGRGFFVVFKRENTEGNSYDSFLLLLLVNSVENQRKIQQAKRGKNPFHFFRSERDLLTILRVIVVEGIEK